MKKTFILLFTIFFAISCSKDDGYHEFILNTYCYAKRNDKRITCYFYFFEKGDYVSVIRNDFDPMKNLGLAIATTKDGKEIQCVGYCYSYNDEVPIAKYRYGIPDIGGKDIVEGEYYVACFPPNLGTGGQHPYKAKTFAKVKDKALNINVNFNYYTSFEPGYKYLEWDE